MVKLGMMDPIALLTSMWVTTIINHPPVITINEKNGYVYISQSWVVYDIVLPCFTPILLNINLSNLFGGLNPSENYYSVGVIIPNLHGKIKNVPNHQPLIVINGDLPSISYYKWSFSTANRSWFTAAIPIVFLPADVGIPEQREHVQRPPARAYAVCTGAEAAWIPGMWLKQLINRRLMVINGD